jgi:cytochrome c oxidase assembly protein subunit 15
LHGANRLASTSLLEGLVWGQRSARHIATELATHNGLRYEDIPPWQPPGREVPDPALIAQDMSSIKHIMWNYVGLVRTTPRLSRAIQDLRNLEVEIERFYRKAALTDELLGLRNAVRVALIVTLAIWAFVRRREPGQPVKLPSALVVIVILQGLLGMWTVTLLLKPLVVVLHLLGGMTTLLLLWWLRLRTASFATPRGDPAVSGWALLTLLVVYTQIALGGWTSSNYAALACGDFPTCHGSLWPPMDLRDAFVLWRGLGVNYEYGVLDAPARTAIHVIHRYGALLTAIIVSLLALRCLQSPISRLRTLGWVLFGVLAAQLALGVGNVVLSLPLKVAVAHNGVAALLLLSVGTVLYFSRPQAGQTRH